jgi:excisionase family DNA binding protein
VSLAIPSAEDIAAIVRREVEAALERYGHGTQTSTLTTEQAAHMAGVTAKTVREWVASGELQASRRGRRLTIRRTDLDAYLSGAPRSSGVMLASLTGPGR